MKLWQQLRLITATLAPLASTSTRVQTNSFGAVIFLILYACKDVSHRLYVKDFPKCCGKCKSSGCTLHRVYPSTDLCLWKLIIVSNFSKPKNARSKRELAKREPRARENPKTTLFLRGPSSSSLVNHLLTDLHALKRPFCVRFNKKNPIHPFEDASSLEFFSQKNDASLLVFGSHSKKRPHCLTWVRCFGGKVLDMMELCVVQDTARTLIQFKGEKCDIGLKPLLSFSGSQFESPVSNQYTLAKSMFVDFFRGGETQTIDVEGLQLLVSFLAGEDGPEGEPAQIHMRCWKIVTKRSGQRVPRVEVEEIGPRIDFTVGRIKEADEALLKEAMKVAKGSEVRRRLPLSQLQWFLISTYSSTGETKEER